MVTTWFVSLGMWLTTYGQMVTPPVVLPPGPYPTGRKYSHMSQLLVSNWVHLCFHMSHSWIHYAPAGHWVDCRQIGLSVIACCWEGVGFNAQILTCLLLSLVFSVSVCLLSWTPTIGLRLCMHVWVCLGVRFSISLYLCPSPPTLPFFPSISSGHI